MFFFLFSINTYSNEKNIDDIKKQEVFKSCLDDKKVLKELGVSVSQYTSFCSCMSMNSLNKNGEFRKDFKVLLNSCYKEIITIVPEEEMILNCEGTDNLPPYSKLDKKYVFQVKEGYIYFGLGATEYKIVSFNDLGIKALNNNLIGSKKEYGVIILDRVNKEIEMYHGFGGGNARILKRDLIFDYKFSCKQHE